MFVLGQTVMISSGARSHGGYEQRPFVVQEAMAATNSGPSDKVLSIIPADQHWLKSLPRPIALYEAW